jgi:hypothetical protein
MAQLCLSMIDYRIAMSLAPLNMSLNSVRDFVIVDKIHVTPTVVAVETQSEAVPASPVNIQSKQGKRTADVEESVLSGKKPKVLKETGSFVSAGRFVAIWVFCLSAYCSAVSRSSATIY